MDEEYSEVTVPSWRVGLVGAGLISEMHLRALERVPGAHVVGVCDRDLKRAQLAAQQSQALATVELDELLLLKLDVVHVLTPPSSHAAIAIAALKAGCHVFIEKPMATSVEECDAIIAAGREAGRQVCVGHSLLMDPFIGKALAMAREGKVGEVIGVEYLRSSEYPPWKDGPVPVHYREGGFPWRDLGVHALYLMEAAMGDIVDVSVEHWSRGLTDRNLLFDEWRATVRTEHGRGSIQLSWNVRPMQNVLIIQGTRGMIRADMFGMSVSWRRVTPIPNGIERLTNSTLDGLRQTLQVPWNVGRFLTKKLRQYHGLQEFVVDFYDRLATGQPMLVDGEAGKRIVAWVEPAARKADAGLEAYKEQFPPRLTAEILITGGSGFIGRTLVKRLMREGKRMRLLVRRLDEDLVGHPMVEQVLGDLGDEEAVARAMVGVRRVFHIGATMRGSSEDFHRGTVVGTGHVVEQALANGVQRMVYVSSLSVLHAALAEQGDVADEDWPLEPMAELRGAYTQSKLAAEELVMLAAKGRDLPVIVLRPGQVFGPGGPLLTGAVARRAGKRLVILGDGDAVLPLVHVDDVVEAIMKAANADAELNGEIFHLVDRKRYTQNALAAMYGKSIVRIPWWLIVSGAWSFEQLSSLIRRPLPINRYRFESALSPIVYTCDKAAEKLLWELPMGAERGVRRAVEDETGCPPYG